MIYFKDKYSLGIIVSIFANFIRNIFTYICYYFNISQYLARQIAAATFLPQTKVNSFLGIIIGTFADYGVAISLGVIIIYLLYLTGTAYPLLKGISMGLLYWLLLFGMMLRFGLSEINPTDLNTNIVFLINHILLGVLIAWLANMYGKKILKNN
ncbi:hypothetical protein [Natroniella sp. ANB-PHB2]|uniref:hypothetical protein n=1 Tax=Natroniella sp. ANB-PHB2 TaxID=3384444 RepID=UPI0038D3A1C1